MIAALALGKGARMGAAPKAVSVLDNVGSTRRGIQFCVVFGRGFFVLKTDNKISTIGNQIGEEPAANPIASGIAFSPSNGKYRMIKITKAAPVPYRTRS